jgi:hypothetical protein
MRLVCSEGRRCTIEGLGIRIVMLVNWLNSLKLSLGTVHVLHPISNGKPPQVSSLICSEFNHFRGESGKCELVPGATILSTDTIYEQCDGFTPTWYERTAYRKIPYSSCEGGERPDRGKAHACPGLVGGGGLSGLFWGSIAILPFALAGLAGYWWYHNAGRPGYVYLPL